MPTDIAEEEDRRTAAAVGTRCSPALVGSLPADCGSLDPGSKTSRWAISDGKGAADAAEAAMRRMLIVAPSGKRVL
jgi:hypothetical protein